ncbi:MAG TPA: nucleotide sugar dehydrogenase, partial [Acidimicrobiales bacterium]|nr:nucleotide sugar dehydrogenase [Acidimicrobiales bacterium]
AVQRFYDTLVDKTVAVSSPKEAELTKLLENTFRHVNIALMNEVAMFAHELGIDAWQAVDAASTKPFGYLRFTPGPGVGGHCLPIDPSYLSWRVKDSLGHAFRFVELANDINAQMPGYVVRRLQTALNERGVPVHGRQILLVGLAYKRNTGDAREAPAGPIARLLHDLGADVRGTDPHVDDDAFGAELRRVELTAEEVADADAVLVLADHDAFDLDLVARHATYVLDTRHALTGDHVEHL